MNFATASVAPGAVPPMPVAVPSATGVAVALPDIFGFLIHELAGTAAPGPEAGATPAKGPAPAVIQPRTTTGSRPQDKATAGASKTQNDIVVPVQLPAVDAPLIFVLPKAPIPEGAQRSSEKAARPEAAAADPAPAPSAIRTDVALQIRLRTPDAPAPDQLPVPVQAEPVRAKPKPADLVRNAEMPADESHEPEAKPAGVPQRLVTPPVHVTTVNPDPHRDAPAATPALAPVTEVAGETAMPVRPNANSAPTSPTAHFVEPVPDQKAVAPPLRSVSLEFTPEGAGDIKLRLSERAGEVHISLHSNDAALSGRLHDGVHSLLGSLAGAGYDAEAWTAGREHHQQRPPDEQQKARRPRGSSPDDFKDMFQPTNEETS